MRVVGGNTLEFHSEELGSIPDARSNSLVVQLVERCSVKAKVAGSRPAEGATAPSSSFGLGRKIVNLVTWVQIPLGPPN